MTVKLSPIGNDAPFLDASGIPLNAGQLFTYLAGSVSTSQTTYTDSAGTVPNANPIVLNSNGYPASGGNVVEIWLTSGVAYKFILKTSAGVTVWNRDNISGVNDTTITLDQWVSGPAPTYVSATSFTLVGDQTTLFHVGRRLKTTNSGGTIYSTITASAFGAVTTITIANDSGTLDSGLSAVSYGLLAASNPSTPLLSDTFPIASGSSDATKKVRLEIDGLTTGTTRIITAQDQNLTLGALSRSYLAGLTMSTAGSSTTMTVAAGGATDSTNVMEMILASSIGKTTGTWAVGTGNGGLDTGAIANSTWYHFWLIMRPDTGLVDILISLSASAPTMPANYTLKRRIGSGLTTAGGNWTSFTQDGDYFRWATSVLDSNVAGQGTNAATITLASIPTSINVHALLNVSMAVDAGATVSLYLSDLAANDEAASDSAAPLATLRANQVSFTLSASVQIRTNTSAQIRSRWGASSAGSAVRIATLGWIDRRGRDA